MINFKRLAMITLFAILATACGTQQPTNSKSPDQSAPKTATQDIQNFLAQAQVAGPEKAAQLKVEAAKLMLLQHKYNDVIDLLSNITQTGFNDALKFELSLTKAKASVGLNDGFSAIQYLSSITSDKNKSDTLLLDKYNTLATAYGLTNQLKNEVIARINASQYLSDTNQLLEANEIIWQLFKPLDVYELKASDKIEDNNYTLRGWLALQIGLKENPHSQKIAANEWHKRWASHSAAKYQPLDLATYLSKAPLRNTDYPYQHVAVALPKSGKYAKGADAIIKGIKLAAQAPQNTSYQISYIDTAIYNSADAIIAQAQLINADAIIGPIDRNLVSELAQIPSLPLPVLALNTTAIGNSNLYQFSLSNEDEVRDSAVRAFNDGKRNVLALVSDDAQGELAANIFTDTFSSLGGRVLATSRYNTDEGNVTAPIAAMLQLNPSTIRGLQRKVKTAHLRQAIRRMTRKDADAIFLFANKSDAYQIGPSLLYFYADNLPLYSTSRIHSGKVDPIKDVDLNGMMFGDLPWVLTPSQSKATLASSVNNTETRFGRLYAFGIDALNIAPKLFNLSTQPSATFTGETGDLTISTENFVQKKLTWAKFEDGALINLPAQ